MRYCDDCELWADCPDYASGDTCSREGFDESDDE